MNGWSTAALGEIAASVDYGVTASAAQQPVGPKFLRITDIQNGSVDWEQVPWCHCGDRAASDSRLQPGDIVFARTGATTGKSFLIRECPSDCVFASYLIRVRVRKEVDPTYVHHYFQTPEYWEQVTRNARGVAQPGVNASTLKILKLPLPSLSEQRRIAAILDKADDLRAKRREALAQFGHLVQSIFFSRFGDPVVNPYGFSKLRLEQLCRTPEDIRCGPFGTQLGKHEVRSEGIALWGIRNVNAGFHLPTNEFLEERTARQLEQYSLQPGDIVMTRKGTVGNCAVYPEGVADGIMHSDLLRIRVNRNICDPLFLSHQLHYSVEVERQLKMISGGAVMPGINVTKLKELKVLQPPRPLQTEFARSLEAIERLKAKHLFSSKKMDVLFASLQHRAFRGEL